MKYFRILALVGALSMFFGCVGDLEVINENNPDKERVLVTPGDIESLIAGAYRTFWIGSEHWIGALHTSPMADEQTSSWGNGGMKDYSSEPRVAIVNTTSYGERGAIENPWYRSYSAISSVNDALFQIMFNEVEIGNVTGGVGADTKRAVAYGKFLQGLIYGYLGCYFDQAYIVDETTDLNLTLTLAPYSEVLAAGIGYLEESITLIGSANFTIDWVGPVSIDAVQLKKLANSYIARYLAQGARTPEERFLVDWPSVKTHAMAGIDADWGPMGDGYDLWYSDWRWVAANPGWTRADYHTIGVTDSRPNFADWLATAVADRDGILIFPIDRRITGSTADAESDGLYFRFAGFDDFRDDRGTYHHSMYITTVWDAYKLSEAEQMTTISVPEMQFLIAEAELAAGNLAAAATIIDSYGVTNGELPAILGSTDLVEIGMWLKYNKRIEVYTINPTIALFDDRGWGDLVAGTPIHFPVPAKELEVSVLDVYTFGGGGNGTGSAGFTPKRIDGKTSRQ